MFSAFGVLTKRKLRNTLVYTAAQQNLLAAYFFQIERKRDLVGGEEVHYKANYYFYRVETLTFC